jgi:hypothetical protein
MGSAKNTDARVKKDASKANKPSAIRRDTGLKKGMKVKQVQISRVPR